MSDYAKDVLVEPEWLEEHLNDESIRIVEVDENPALYAEAHIPGAIGFDWKEDLQDHVRRDFLGARGLREAFRQPRHLRRPHDRRLRRPQQLVRRLHLLVPEVLRPRQGAAAQRPARKVDLRWAPDDGGGAERCSGDLHRAAWRRRDPRRARRGPRRDQRRHEARRRALARRVRGRGDLAARLRAGGGTARGAHPGRALDPVGAGRQGRRDVQVGRRTARALRAARARSTARTSSPTAASASARRTRGSCCTSSSAATTSRTTTALGRSGATSWPCRSRSGSS